MQGGIPPHANASMNPIHSLSIHLLAVQVAIGPAPKITLFHNHFSVQQLLIPLILLDVQPLQFPIDELTFFALGAHDDDSSTNLARTSRPSQPVNVRLAILGTSELNDVCHIWIIHTSCGYICREQNALLPLAEFVRGECTIRLTLFGMDFHCRNFENVVGHVTEELTHCRSRKEYYNLEILRVLNVDDIFENVHQSRNHAIFRCIRQSHEGLIHTRIGMRHWIHIMHAIHGEIIFPHVTRHDGS
mmetsp:Transcript_4703/g.10660  ORF Transcript_4703/g.10660 Transcript_4703/m.10660 type:complete len:245 (+) Transcript_4703:609-1343(+)